MKNIHQMLNNIDEDKYLDNEKPLLENEKERILSATMDKINNSIKSECMYDKSKLNKDDLNSKNDNYKSKNKKFSRKKIIAIILAATLMISTLSFAADYFSFNARLTNLLSIDENSHDLVNKSGMNINKSVGNKGIKIKATQAIGDKNCAYILFEVTLDDKLNKENKYFFENVDYQVYSKKFGYTGCTGSFEMLDSDNSDDNTAHFLCCMEYEDINNRDLKFVFEDFGYYKDGNYKYEDFVKLIDGTWTLKFKLDYKNTSKTYVINKNYKVKDRNIRVKTIEISPLSARIKMNGKYQEFVSKVTMKDGTIYEGDEFFINNSASYATIGRDLFGRSESYTGFSKVLNVNDIKSITINDEVEIELP